MPTPHYKIALPSVAILAILCVSLAGCGNGMVRVTGVVTLDETPIADAAVMFQPVEGGRPATGRTDAEGHFELMTVKPRDGVAPGSYRVSITACQPLVEEDEAGPTTDEDYETEAVRWIVPQSYSRAETSGLEVTVSRGERHFPFALRGDK